LAAAPSERQLQILNKKVMKLLSLISKLPGLVAIAATVALATSASADQVYVGYADGLRLDPHFPSIWAGSSGTVFVGGTTSGFDAGAIMLHNDSAVSQSIDISASFSWDSTFNHDWGAVTVGAGQYLIVTQTLDYNFDTSDLAALTPFGSPLATGNYGAGQVSLVIDGGAPHNYLDTAHILNTGGFDLALGGANESQNWRLIGTTGIEDPGGSPPSVPETSSTVMMLFAGMISLLGFGWRGRRLAAMAGS
jgi:hypothetical protein